MNIPEYCQYKAERIDNGETVKGYYVFYQERSCQYPPKNPPIIDHRIVDTHYDFYSVKPETIRRVAIKPIFEWIDGYGETPLCPNCKTTIYSDSFNCCHSCGMALKRD